MSDLFRQAMLQHACQMHADAVCQLNMMIAVNQVRMSTGSPPYYTIEDLERAGKSVSDNTINPHTFG